MKKAREKLLAAQEYGAHAKADHSFLRVKFSLLLKTYNAKRIICITELFSLKVARHCHILGQHMAVSAGNSCCGLTTAAATAELLPVFAHLLPELVNEQIVDDWINDVVDVVAIYCPCTFCDNRKYHETERKDKHK